MSQEMFPGQNFQSSAKIWLKPFENKEIRKIFTLFLFQDVSEKQPFSIFAIHQHFII